MEREKELIKLINVLRRTSRMALQSEWTGGKEDAAAFCTDQYNRVLARLKELDPGVSTIFEPLPAGSSLTVVAMASRQLAAYYEDELGPARGPGRRYGFAFDPGKFKEFWERSSRDFEDMGEFIRESIDEWLRHKKEAGRSEKGTPRSNEPAK
ncbi:MAG TPA: hypothetical protein VJ751_00565 [Pyrinomonadaceae bacterium]|jgi:hypothetical protein|nr:hypothetical protein [Pyrinomonadaceae bacterium]